MQLLTKLWQNSIPQQSWTGLVGYPFIIRWLVWNFVRNPFGFILKSVALPKVNSPTFNPKGGFLFLRFFVSYRGSFLEAYFGFRPDGIFGISLRKAHASNEKGQPG